MFNEQLHRRLDDEEEVEVHVRLLAGFYQELSRVIEEQSWKQDEGLRHILAAGMRAVAGWKAADKPVGEMTRDEQLSFHRNRASSLDAAYGPLKFLAYQVMNQNDALEMNMKGLLPQLEAARGRVEQLEEEVRRLREQAPKDQRRSDVLVLDRNESAPDHKSWGARISDWFGRKH